MADIEAERRGPTVWPWIIGLLLLSLIVWALMEMYSAAGEAASGGATADSVSVDTGRGPIPPDVPTAPGLAPADSVAPRGSGRDTMTPPP